jgi:hypothetical protein
MRRFVLTGVVVLILTIVLLTSVTGCFFSSKQQSSDTPTPSAVKPAPEVLRVTETTSGTQSAYYVTLEIKVKNTGAEGTILVNATLTQAGKSSFNQMPVFLKQNETHELKMTFPLVWQGGKFESQVEAVVP